MSTSSAPATFLTGRLGLDAKGSLDARQLGFGRVEELQVVSAATDNGSFCKHGIVPGSEFSIVGCMDGRRMAPGVCLAGGTLTAAVMYMVTHDLRGKNIINVFDVLHSLGISLILHEDCGALKNFTLLLQQIAAAGKDYEAIARLLSGPLLTMDISLLSMVAERLSEVDFESFMVTEEELFDAVEKRTGRVEHFSLPDHAEVAVVVNFVPNTTMCRDVLPYEPGAARAFSVDAWAIPLLAKLITKNSDAPGNPELASLAAFAFNAAVVLTLGGSGLVVVARRPAATAS